MSATIDGLFLAALERFPERRFLRHLRGGAEQTLDYRAAAGRLAATLERLDALGVRAGDRVVVWLDEIVVSIQIALACAHAGVITVPLSPGHAAAAALRLAARVEARAVLTLASRAEALRAAGAGPRVLGVLDGTSAAGADAIDLRATLPPGAAEPLLRRAAAGHGPDDLYCFLPTSGTTGEPKLVVRPHRTVVRSGRQLALDLRAEREPPERLLLVAALTHGMGQLVTVAALSLAAELCVPGDLDVRARLDEVRALDPTYVVATPRVLRALEAQRRSAGGARLFGPSAHTVRTGGAPPDPALLERLAGEGVDVGASYGSVESGLLAITARGQWRPGWDGDVLADAELRLAADGELEARTPSLMPGYHADLARTREVFTADGFYRTGDYAEIAGGRLRVLGRKRDVLNTFEGMNVYPARLEAQLEALPWVREVAILGDQRPWLVALVVVRDEVAPPPAAPDGYLDERAFAPLYRRARADLAALNAPLETYEEVRGCLLFARPLPPDLYALVGHGKVRRDRAGLAAAYRARLEALYDAAPAAPAGGGA
jgi:long-chain acyl-CoA synthetase